MRAHFSETNFGQQVYRELRQRYPTSVPYAPSTNAEQWAPYDLDVPLSLTRSLFLQFKVPECMVRSDAEEWAAVGRTKYFRFSFHRSDTFGNAQNDLLKFLSEDFPRSVFYVSALFHKWDQFSALIKADAVCKNSAFIPLDQCRYLNDNNEHRMVYIRSRRFWQLSESITDVFKTGDELFEEIDNELVEDRNVNARIGISEDLIRARRNEFSRILLVLRSGVLDLTPPIYRESQSTLPQRPIDELSDSAIVAEIRWIAMTYYDARWIPIGWPVEGLQ